MKALSKLLDGQRVCRNCFARSAAVPCSRCGSVREPAARDADGSPLCPNCLVNDPANLEECGLRMPQPGRRRALPDRDECLARLELWVTAAIGTQEDPGQRRVLHGYAVWHHLRKLRRRLGGAHATYLQALNVRCHVTAAAGFLDWLASEDLTLTSCAQPDLDRWACGEDTSYSDETAHFVRWAVSQRHASRLTFGAVRWEGPRGPHDGEKRWDDARRLLHDDTLATPDRVAGLLLLLYAQRINSIARLTAGHVRDDGDQVRIMLGTAPVVLPEPLAELFRELVATRRGHAAVGRPGITPWLFPGGRPGQPIGGDRLGTRLKNIGLHLRQARSTALFTLAAEIPAAILARMLGIHVQVAVQWQRASAGDWMTYAADVSRRGPGDISSANPLDPAP